MNLSHLNEHLFWQKMFWPCYLFLTKLLGTLDILQWMDELQENSRTQNSYEAVRIKASTIVYNCTNKSILSILYWRSDGPFLVQNSAWLCLLILFTFANIFIQVLQSFSYYFETFWCFAKFSFNHKWNDARLLLINMVYKSCLMSYRTT